MQGQSILVRQGDGLVEAGGQLRFDFQGVELPPLAASPELESQAPPVQAAGVLRSVEDVSVSAEQMRSLAAEWEDAGRLSEAADLHRAAMAAAGPDPEGCFQLAELLYRQGDLSGARERYYMAIELDEDYVEARANLGCVLAETGQRELAIAAFEGALRYHPDYADAHYHLARTLDDMGHRLTAEQHWRKFLSPGPGQPLGGRSGRAVEAVGHICHRRVREANRWGNGGFRTEPNARERLSLFWTGSRNAPCPGLPCSTHPTLKSCPK